MAKFGLGSGSASAPAATPSFFPEAGSQQRYDMIMQLLQSGMQSASQSGSPIASFLAPIAGAAIGGRATKQHNDARQDRYDEMTAAILGQHANNPEAQKYIAVMNDDSAPAYLRSIAKHRLDRLLGVKGGRGTGGGTGRGNVRLTGSYTINGILHGRDNRGNMVPYLGSDGNPIRAVEGLEGIYESATPPTPPAAVEAIAPPPPPPSVPGSSHAQPQPVVDEHDPLGILRLPPT